MSLKEMLDNRVRRYQKNVTESSRVQANKIAQIQATVIWQCLRCLFLLIQKENNQVIIYIGTAKNNRNSETYLVYKYSWLDKWHTLPFQLGWPSKVLTYVKEKALKDGLDIVDAAISDYNDDELSTSIKWEYKIVYNAPRFEEK